MSKRGPDIGAVVIIVAALALTGYAYAVDVYWGHFMASFDLILSAWEIAARVRTGMMLVKVLATGCVPFGVVAD